MGWLYNSTKEFLQAAREGNIKTIQEYLKTPKAQYWLSVRNDQGRDAIAIAAMYDQLKALEILMAAQPIENPKDNKFTPLHYAARFSEKSVVIQKLLSLPEWAEGANFGAPSTPLLAAVLGGKAGNVKLFLDSGKADLSIVPYVAHAISSSRIDMLDMLLAAGADPNDLRKSYDSSRIETPLYLAASNQKLETTVRLLAAGADPNTPTLIDNKRHYPLLSAAKHDNLDIVKALVEHGADVFQQDSDGRTALVNASIQGRISIVRYLLEQGPHKDAGAALEKALTYDRTEIVILLRAHLASPPPSKIDSGALEAEDMWQRAGDTELVHIRTYPALNRRLTDIFNFETCERAFISENTSTKQEGTPTVQNFDSLTDELLDKAVLEFKQRGGKVNEASVFRNRMRGVKKLV